MLVPLPPTVVRRGRKRYKSPPGFCTKRCKLPFSQPRFTAVGNGCGPLGLTMQLQEVCALTPSHGSPGQGAVLVTGELTLLP